MTKKKPLPIDPEIEGLAVGRRCTVCQLWLEGVTPFNPVCHDCNRQMQAAVKRVTRKRIEEDMSVLQENAVRHMEDN